MSSNIPLEKQLAIANFNMLVDRIETVEEARELAKMIYEHLIHKDVVVSQVMKGSWNKDVHTSYSIDLKSLSDKYGIDIDKE